MRGTGELRHGVLGLADAVAQSVAVLALALGVAFGSSGAAAAAGASVPLAYLIAGAASLCLASIVIRFTRRIASAGALYAYVASGLSPSAGFVGGWLYAGAFAFGMSFVLVISSFFLSVAMQEHAGLDLSWSEWFVPLLVLLVALALLDVRISTRVQLVLAACGVAAVLALAVAITVQGGDSGLSLAPLDPTAVPDGAKLWSAVVLGFTGFIGFEAAAVLGEEVRDPLRTIPRAVLAAVLVALGLYVFVTWAMAVGFGTGSAAAWASDPAALDTLATRYVGSWLAIVIDFAVAAAGFVGALGALTLTSRTLFAMARDGGLPRALAWTHPRLGTPWAGILAAGALTLLLWLIVARHYGPITYFVLVATTATLAILVTYMLVALSGILYFLRTDHGGLSLIADTVPAAVAIAICAYTIYKSIFPRPEHPVSLAPYLAGGWLLLGVLVAAVLSARHPDRVRAFGSIMAPGVPVGNATAAGPSKE
jgi:amino acid transporter